MKSHKIRGMNIHSISREKLKDNLEKDIKDDILRQHISITNSEAVYIGDNSLSHFNFINNAKFSLCDGVGIQISALFHGEKIKRYHGPDFFIDTIIYGEKYGWTHYLLGGQPGIANKLKNLINNKYPKCKIIGYAELPFSEEPLLNDKTIKEINLLKPNFIWLSLGLPKGEKFIMKYKKKLNVNFITHIGAAFDFHTNNIKRAPIFFQKIGLEWLYRTYYERRLIFRVIRSFKIIIKIFFSNKSSH